MLGVFQRNRSDEHGKRKAETVEDNRTCSTMSFWNGIGAET